MSSNIVQLPDLRGFLSRRGSSKNVDRFTTKRAPKAQASRGSRGMLPREIFSILKCPFLAF